jgi:ketosteroid isomerase-like protein
MSQENVERAYRLADAFNQRDLDAFLALCDPDGEFHSRLVELEGGGPYRGHDGVRSWWENLFAISPDLRSEVEGVRDAGDMTIARVRQRGHGVESDAPMGQTQWVVTEWRDKKAVWSRIVLSEAEALEAAGLSE